MAHFALAGLIGWLAALSISVAAYLLSLRVEALRRNRAADTKRNVLEIS